MITSSQRKDIPLIQVLDMSKTNLRRKRSTDTGRKKGSASVLESIPHQTIPPNPQAPVPPSLMTLRVNRPPPLEVSPLVHPVTMSKTPVLLLLSVSINEVDNVVKEGLMQIIEDK